MEEAMETIKSESKPGDDLWRNCVSCEKYREALIDAAAAGEQVKANLPNTSRNAHTVALHCNAKTMHKLCGFWVQFRPKPATVSLIPFYRFQYLTGGLGMA